MGKLSPKRVAIIVAFVGLSVGGWLATRGADGVESIGGTWVAPDAIWHETNGAWRGGLTFEPQAVRLRAVSEIELLAALCASTLENLAGLGAGEVDPSDIYRLDLNILLDDQSPIFAFPASVPVQGGTCQIDMAGDSFHPTYPAPLTQWYLSQTGAVNALGQDAIPFAQFQNRPDVDAALSGFDFIAACTFLIDDPKAWAPSGQPAPTDGRLRIMARNGANLGSLAAGGVFIQDELNIENGVCSMAEGS